MKSWDPHLLPRSMPSHGYHVRHLNPPKLLLVGFIALIAAGTLLLKLPWAHNGGLTWVDAAFTATSAVTVTGLVVADTGTQFTLLGQLIILGLIQLGGIGFMTFAVLMASALGFRLGLRQQLLAQEGLQQPALSTIRKAATSIAIFAITIEAIGLLVLSFSFVPELGWAHGLYHSLFYSVSAFNNAGFALSPDSLVPYSTNWNVCLAVSFLFIIGGLGFLVVIECFQQRRFSRLSIYSRLIIVSTVILNGIAFVLFVVFEYDNPVTLGGIEAWGDKLLAAWFQATTPRTAGFNSLHINDLSLATCVLFLLLMFIGGAPNSTAGGIKISTLVVMFAATRSFLAGNLHVDLGRHSLRTDVVLRCLAVTTIGMLTIFIVILCLSLLETATLTDIAFEVVSAFGTVGLSRGITESLSAPSQLLIMFTMVIGRVGPLALGYILAMSSKHSYRYAYTDMPVG